MLIKIAVPQRNVPPPAIGRRGETWSDVLQLAGGGGGGGGLTPGSPPPKREEGGQILKGGIKKH